MSPHPVAALLVDLLRVSRPRFWMYLLGPFMLALAASSLQPPVEVWLLGLYLTLPANLLIYGVNDLFDAETDRLNPKKRDYEHLLRTSQRRVLTGTILVLNLPFLLLVPFLPHAWPWLAVFVITGLGYSMPPLRAKGRPILDSAFNILYVAPGFAAYAAVSGQQPAAPVVVAALLWCMAMHAYSAVPDIAADRAAGVPTVATLLGPSRTLACCGLAYTVAAVLAFPFVGWFALIAGLVYLTMILLSLGSRSSDRLFGLYRCFPFLNTAIGAGLFCVIGLQRSTWPFDLLLAALTP